METAELSQRQLMVDIHFDYTWKLCMDQVITITTSEWTEVVQIFNTSKHLQRAPHNHLKMVNIFRQKLNLTKDRPFIFNREVTAPIYNTIMSLFSKENWLKLIKNLFLYFWLRELN